MTSPARLRLRIIASALFLLLFNTGALFHNLPRALAGETDFRSLYAAGAILRTGQAAHLYQYDLQRTVQNTLVSPRPGAIPFLYPPFAALPFVPLSALPYRTAYLLFLAINALLLFAASSILSPYLPALRNLSPAIPTLLFLAFFPVTVVFYHGQVSLIFLVILSAAYAFLEQQRPLLAGLALSLLLVKFQLAFPIVLLFVVWRNWRLLWGWIAGSAILALASFTIEGQQGIRLYLTTLLSATSNGAIATRNPDMVFPGKMPNLHGLWSLLLGSSHWTAPLVLFTSAAVLLWTALQPPSLPRALTATLLVSYHLHMHDVTLLLLPIALVLNQALNAFQSRRPQPRRLQTLTSLLWLISPITLYLIAIGASGLLAPALLPFLVSPNDGCPSLTEGKGGDTA